MAELKECLEAELENIQKILSQLPPVSKFSSLNGLELAGVAALIHHFYNFTHSYAFDLDPDQLNPLVKNVKKTFRAFLKDIQRFF